MGVEVEIDVSFALRSGCMLDPGWPKDEISETSEWSIVKLRGWSRGSVKFGVRMEEAGDTSEFAIVQYMGRSMSLPESSSRVMIGEGPGGGNNKRSVPERGRVWNNMSSSPSLSSTYPRSS